MSFVVPAPGCFVVPALLATGMRDGEAAGEIGGRFTAALLLPSSESESDEDPSSAESTNPSRPTAFRIGMRLPSASFSSF